MYSLLCNGEKSCHGFPALARNRRCKPHLCRGDERREHGIYL
ncbi:MAG: hypothetical protein DBX59_11040 [Bacillota bacterium]|nr:MAG: hypothetical protein DBX59_11040 [Bacillota bacterium]